MRHVGITPTRDVDRWGKLAAGDVVAVRGERGRFTVLSFRLDDAGGCAWVNVAGGRNGRHMLRSFTPERLRKVRA